MGGFGENLRRERESRGISLDDISAATKIGIRLLQAIEEEDFDRLPGGIFNINFVRQYARHLGLDEDRVVAEFRSLTAPLAETAGVIQRSSGPDPEWTIASAQQYDWDRRPDSRGWVLATAALVVAGVFGGAYVWRSGRHVHSAAPPPTSAPAPAPAAQQPPPAPAPVAEEPVVPVTPKTAPTMEAPIRVQLQATGIVWVSVIADGEVKFQDTLQPEQTRSVAAQKRIRLRVGDASAVNVTFNGVAQPPIGPQGQVRTVIVTPEGMRVVAPPPEEENAPKENP